MKRLAVLALAANGLFAADFVTGQAARAVVGQIYFTSQDATSSNGILGAAGGVALANGMLVVTDSNRMSAQPLNNRVLIYRNIDGQIPPPTGQPVRSGLQRCPLCGFTADVVLGQSDFTSFDPRLSQTGMRTPTAAATDGVRLAVADTDNNRVLIWNTIPSFNGAAPDLVLGQPDFVTGTANSGSGDIRVPSARTFRGPQGLWIQNGKLFVSDNQNHRVLIWNAFPTSNFQPADVVAGQADFTTVSETGTTAPPATASSLLNPVAVTSDGVRMIVTDLGNNRVLIWKTIPTQNGVPADIVIGQPDMVSTFANYSYKFPTGSTVAESVLCASNGTDSTTGNPTFPARCGATLNFPRFALSDGTRLFIADGGNDRVLIFNSIPTQNAAKADVVLGQFDMTYDQVSDSSGNPDIDRRSASDAMRTPTSLAWDGTNLYVSEPFSRRVLVFTPGVSATLDVVRNAASMEVFAVGVVTFTGSVKAGDVVTIKINNDKTHNYTAKQDDTLALVATGLANAINADKDPWMIARADAILNEIILTAVHGGSIGNSIPLTTTSSNTNLTVSAGTVGGGGNAAALAAGSLISIFGRNFTTQAVPAPSGSGALPTNLGGVQVYVDGLPVPLLYVGPNQINAQLPYEVFDPTTTTSSSNLYVRMTRPDGSVQISDAVGIPLVPANPGIFAGSGSDPRPGTVIHSSSQATGTVLIDGSAVAGDVVTVTISGRTYTYTVVSGDTLDTVRDALIARINSGDPQVEAFAGGEFDRIRLRARVKGTSGNGIVYTVADTGGHVIMSASSGKLCCANVAGSLVTASNPAIPGETISVFATGLGMINDPAKFNVHTGLQYHGPVQNKPDQFVSSLAGGKTANVLYDGMMQGAVGIFQVDLELNSSLVTDPATQLTISQNAYTSNIITFPVKAP